MIILIIITILLVIELCFLSLMKNSIRNYNELVFDIDRTKGGIKAGLVFRIDDNPELCMMSLNLTEKFFSIVLMSIIFVICGQINFNFNWQIAIFLSTSLVFCTFVCRIIPSILAQKYANKILRIFSSTASFQSVVFYPFLWVIMLPILSIVSAYKKQNDYKKIILPDVITENSQDLSGNQDVNNKPELKILRKAMDFRNVKIKECMVPRNEIVAIEVKESINNLKEKFISSEFSKILIYKNNIDKILGYVNALALFKNPQNISKEMISVIDVPESMTADKVFNLLIKRRRSVAVVIDEYGQTAGMLTIEDIIEEIIGEINDEHDQNEYLEKQISEKEFVFSGRLEIDYINEKYNLELPTHEDYQTLAGMVLKLYQAIPDGKIEIDTPKYIIKVLQVNKPIINIIGISVK